VSALGIPRQPLPRGARAFVLRFVASGAWRSELTIIRHFARRYTQTVVEDTLFELVLAKKVAWFGAEDPNGHLPLRYRVTP